MPAPPIENPTPFTCFNCGAALTKRADFCPGCGARLEWARPRSAGAVAALIVFALDVTGFGFLGACSAVVIGTSVSDGSAGGSAAFLAIFVLPLLVLGLVGAGFCGHELVRRWRE